MKNKTKKVNEMYITRALGFQNPSIRFSRSKTDSFVICGYFSLSFYFPLEKILRHDFFPLGDNRLLSSVSWYYEIHATSKEKLCAFDLRIRVDMLTIILIHAPFSFYVQSRLAWLEKKTVMVSWADQEIQCSYTGLKNRALSIRNRQATKFSLAVQSFQRKVGIDKYCLKEGSSQDSAIWLVSKIHYMEKGGLLLLQISTELNSLG